MFSLKRISVVLTVCALLLASVTAFAGEKPGYLGVMLQDISVSMAKALELDEDGGAIISEVLEDSPAEKAGLKDGDVILEFDGKTIYSHKSLTKAVRKTTPGEEIKVKVLRGGKTKNLEVVVGKREKNENFAWFDSGHNDHSFNYDDDLEIIMEGFDGPFASDRGFLGVQLDDLNEQLGKYFAVENGEGALITRITEDSSAEKAGLKAGDVIVRIENEDITSAADVHKAMAATKAEDEIKIQVLRKGKTKKFEVTLDEMSMESIRKIEFISENDYDSLIAPKKLMKHFKLSGTHGPKHMGHVKYMGDHESFELDEVREELEELRLELEKLREDLKKK